jgi:general secretion pathway protein I
MAELAARRAWPGVGVTEGSERQAGIEFRWRAEIVATPHPLLRRVEIRVADPDDASHELRRLVGVLAKEF